MKFMTYKVQHYLLTPLPISLLKIINLINYVSSNC